MTHSIHHDTFWDQVPAEYLRTLVEQGRSNGLPTSIFSLGDPHRLETPGVVVIKAGGEHTFPRHCHDCERFEVVLAGSFTDATGHEYRAGDIMIAHHMEMYGPHLATSEGYIVLELFGSMLGTYELFWDTRRGPRKTNKIDEDAAAQSADGAVSDLPVSGTAPPQSGKVERGVSLLSIHDDSFWNHVPATYLQPLVDGCGVIEGMDYRMFVLGDPDDPEAPTAVVFRAPPGYVLPRHSHDCHRFEVVVQGSLTDEHGAVGAAGSVMTAEPNQMYGPSVAGAEGYISVEIFSRLAGAYEITWDTARGPWLQRIVERPDSPVDR